MRLVTAVTIFSLSACSSGGTTSGEPSTTPKNVVVLNQPGQIPFPSANGIEGSATYSLTAPPPQGATLTLMSQLGGAGLPVPLGSGATVFAAFPFVSNKGVVLSQFPAWQVKAPTSTSLTPPYGIEVFAANTYLGEYAATVSGATISATSFGASTSVAANTPYTFEIVQNPDTSQFPH